MKHLIKTTITFTFKVSWKVCINCLVNRGETRDVVRCTVAKATPKI